MERSQKLNFAGDCVYLCELDPVSGYIYLFMCLLSERAAVTTSKDQH